jgi:hypothetical protein
MMPHLLEERFDFIERMRVREISVVEPAANPEVVHEHREAHHHSSNTPWATEFPPIAEFSKGNFFFS